MEAMWTDLDSYGMAVSFATAVSWSLYSFVHMRHGKIPARAIAASFRQ